MAKAQRVTDFDKVGKYDQNQVNGFDSHAIDSMLDLAELPACRVVLDAMAGDGNLTDQMQGYCKERGIPVPSSVVFELSGRQCGFAAEKLKGCDVKVVRGDILTGENLDTGERLPDNHFDAVMVKSGNHELPLDKHKALYSSLFRVLKPGGRFVNLGVVFDDEEDRREFREILRVKDTLAGLEDAARNRHFLTRNELHPLLREVGFVDVSCGRHMPYVGRTSVVADVYFKQQREEKKIEFEKALMGAISLRKKFQVFTQGDDSIYTFPGEMTVAKKPKLALVR